MRSWERTLQSDAAKVAGESVLGEGGASGDAKRESSDEAGVAVYGGEEARGEEEVIAAAAAFSWAAVQQMYEDRVMACARDGDSDSGCGSDSGSAADMQRGAAATAGGADDDEEGGMVEGEETALMEIVVCKYALVGSYVRLLQRLGHVLNEVRAYTRLGSRISKRTSVLHASLSRCTAAAGCVCASVRVLQV